MRTRLCSARRATGQDYGPGTARRSTRPPPGTDSLGAAADATGEVRPYRRPGWVGAPHSRYRCWIVARSATLLPQAGGSKTLNARASLRSALPISHVSGDEPARHASSHRPIQHLSRSSMSRRDTLSNPFISPAWVCWVTEPLVRSPGTASVLHVARTLDGGQTWRELAPTISSASGCQIATHSRAFSSALLVADGSDGGTGPCSAQLLLTEDDGDSWRSIPTPQAYTTDCAAEYHLFGDTIFASPGADLAAAPQWWQCGGSAVRPHGPKRAQA